MIRLAASFLRAVPAGGEAGDSASRAVRAMLASDGGADGAVASGVARLGCVTLGDDADGPAIEPGGARALLFDGRLDDREELAAALGLSAAATDPELVLAGFARWGDRCLERLLGPFALVLWEPWRRRLLLARDPMGERTLCLRRDDRELVAATTEGMLLAHPGTRGEVDPRAVARYFALLAPPPGRTMFSDLEELEPGRALAVTPDGERSWCFWRPPAEAEGRRSDDEWAGELRRRLAAAVACRLHGGGTPAVLMSGGLDSTAVAALAARRAGGRPPLAVSWTFEELADCDESPMIDRVVAHCGLEPVAFAGDRAWPLADPATWPWEAGRPYSDPFARLLEAAARRARRRGVRTLLTGYWGDQVFAGGAGWAGSLAAERRWPTLAAGVGRRLAEDAGAARRWARHALAGGAARAADDPWPEALTGEARELLGGGGPHDYRAGLLDGLHVWMATARHRALRRRGIELRDPFRDRRVVELALAMPAHQHRRGPVSRPALRRAMRGLLPPEVRRRRDKTSLAALFRRGVLDRELDTVRAVLAGGEWRSYLRPEVVEPVLAAPERPAPARTLTGLWLAIGYELWRGPLAELRSSARRAAS